MACAPRMHLTEEQIAAFVSGGLAPEQLHALEVHLQECGDCLRLVGLSARTALRGSTEQARAPGRAGDARYLVLHELGSGSMGTVYAAYDTKLDRRVALKRIKGSPTEAHRKRLQREAQVMARLEHPHIAAVYDVGVDDEGDFISMQLVDGCSLRQWLREQPRSPTRCCGSSWTPAKGSRPRTRPGSSTATSSRRTCSSARTAGSG